MQSTVFRDTYDLAFQVSPIILHNGIASTALGGMLPIIGLTGQLGGFVQGVLTSGLSLSDFYARFVPIPGANAISNAVGTYPFANQQVAANAIIEQPLNVSLLMIAPVRDKGGYLTKMAIFTSLRNALQAHNNAGGTYHIATPAFVYTDCVMTAMTDVTSGDTKQQNVQWQIDFVKPLITQSDAASAVGSLIGKITAGSQITTPAWSGAEVAAGTAAQGAVAGAQGMSGVINTYSPFTP